MVLEMLAGDELAPDDPDTVRATGFLVRNWDIFNRNAWLANTVEHTARAFLGLTIQCARCHDHKYDPISQADYYRFRAFFEPYHIRIDRVPGQPDRTKAGLPRVFDDFLDRPTYLFHRGDETQPDKSRPLRPAPPAVLGGEVHIAPIPLPLVAFCPDKRAFVIDEARAEADRSVAGALKSAEEARRRTEHAAKTLESARDDDAKAAASLAAAAVKPDRLVAAAVGAVERLARARRSAGDATEDRDVAKAALSLAEAKRSALLAVLAAERLEDEGAKASGSASWAEAASAATAAQRAMEIAEAKSNVLNARRDNDRARRTLDALLLAGAVRDQTATRDAQSKAAAALVEARGRMAVAEKQLNRAQAADKKPLDTAYAPRVVVFPRAKTTYREVPSNTPYSKVSTGRRLALARWIVDRRNPLAARVAVNHVWARHFGEPLVASMSDFGLARLAPS